jgi:hypothetical protein
MRSDGQALERIEMLRQQLHQRMQERNEGDPFARLVPLSEELDRLVVEVTRRQWERTVQKPRKFKKQGV